MIGGTKQAYQIVVYAVKVCYGDKTFSVYVYIYVVILSVTSLISCFCLIFVNDRIQNVREKKTES